MSWWAPCSPGARPKSTRLLASLEAIPPKIVDGVPVVDVEAVLRRRPRVCVIDGLAYNNPPGSRHPYRWQDVQELVDSGITVIASVNLQFIEEERERVEAITGKRVTQTVPKAFLYGADEIVVVDVAPRRSPAARPKPAAPKRGWRRASPLCASWPCSSPPISSIASLKPTSKPGAWISSGERTSASWSASRRAPTPAA